MFEATRFEPVAHMKVTGLCPEDYNGRIHSTNNTS